MMQLSDKNKQVLKYSFNFKEILKELMTPGGIRSLDGLRAIAMIWIIAHHSYTASAGVSFIGQGTEVMRRVMDNTPFWDGWVLGAQYLLDLFFLISGFLITSILFREWSKHKRLNLRLFYYRRFMRLMPVYFFIIFCTFLVMLAAGINGKIYLLSNVFYINNFFDFSKNPLPWTWSMAVEEQFYILLPLFIILTKLRHFALWMVGLMILSVLIRLYIIAPDPKLSETPLYLHLLDPELNNYFKTVIYDDLYTRFGAFICGIALTAMIAFNKEAVYDFFHKKLLGKFLCVLSMVVLFILLFVYNPYKSSVVLSYIQQVFYLSSHRAIFCLAATVFTFLLITKSPFVSWVNKFLSWPVWYPLGQLAYSAYLIHFLIVGGISFGLNKLFGFTFGDGIHLPLLILIASILTYLISLLLYCTIEMPFTRWRNFKSGASSRSALLKENKERNASSSRNSSL